MAKYLFEPAPNETAIDFLRAKRPLGVNAFKQLLPELQAHAMVVSGINNATALQEVRDLVAGVPAGEDYRKTKKRVAEVLGQHLPIEPDLFDDEDAVKKHLAALDRRAEMVVRNNAFQAYSLSAYKELDEFRDLFTHWKYLTVGDGRVRDTHRALNNLVLPNGHPFWRTHFPPWEFGCRCQVVGLTPDEYEEELAADRARPDEERTVLEGALLEQLEQQGTLTRKIGGAPVRINVQSERERGIEGAWRWEPEDLALSFAGLESRYDAQVWGMWQSWAKAADAGNGQTVWDWARRALGAGPALPAPVAAPGVAVVTQGARVLSEVEAAVASLARAHEAAVAEVKAAEAAMASTPVTAPDFAAVTANLKARRAALEAIKEQGREAVSLPVAERGVVALLSDARSNAVKPTIANLAAGQDIVQRYTAAKYLPKVGLDYTPDGRAYYSRGVLHLTRSTSASTVAHEITHGVEIQFPEVLQKSVAFLKSRRGKKEMPKGLRSLTGLNYKSFEITIEDEFVSRGGDHYMGKLYFPGVADTSLRRLWKNTLRQDADAAFKYLNATELLTMGIERLHMDPVGFQRLDPDYFRFVVSTLQDLS